MGTKVGFIQANIEFALRSPELREEMKEYLDLLHEHMDEMLRYE